MLMMPHSRRKWSAPPKLTKIVPMSFDKYPVCLKTNITGMHHKTTLMTSYASLKADILLAEFELKSR